jgi:hypothetical protein
VDAAVAWHEAVQDGEKGLEPIPARMREASKSYMDSNDAIGPFLDETCRLGDDEKVAPVRLYEAGPSPDTAGGSPRTTSFEAEVRPTLAITVPPDDSARRDEHAVRRGILAKREQRFEPQEERPNSLP